VPRRLRCRRPVGSGHADDFSGELTLQRRYDTLATLFFLAIYRRISFSYSGALPYGDRIQLSVTLLLRQTVKGIPSLEDENTLHYSTFSKTKCSGMAQSIFLEYYHKTRV